MMPFRFVVVEHTLQVSRMRVCARFQKQQTSDLYVPLYHVVPLGTRVTWPQVLLGEDLSP